MDKTKNNEKKIFRQNRKSREIVLRIYFPFISNDEEFTLDEVINLFKDEAKNISAIINKEECSKYAEMIFEVLLSEEKKTKINLLIKDNLKNWEYERIPKINLAILHICIAEIIYIKKFNPNIIINEAVILSKKFLDGESYKFINGILAKVSKG